MMVLLVNNQLFDPPLLPLTALFLHLSKHQWRESAQPLWSTGKVFYFLFLFYIFFFYSLHELEVLSTISCFEKGWPSRTTSERLRLTRALSVASVFISYINIYTTCITLSVTFSTSILRFSMKTHDILFFFFCRFAPQVAKSVWGNSTCLHTIMYIL